MYKRIVQECYIISHRIHTSYLDLMKITPLERKYMWELLHAEAEDNRERMESLQKKSEEIRNTRNKK